jgi:hypothetical protein
MNYHVATQKLKSIIHILLDQIYVSGSNLLLDIELKHTQDGHLIELGILL